MPRFVQRDNQNDSQLCERFVSDASDLLKTDFNQAFFIETTDQLFD